MKKTFKRNNNRYIITQYGEDGTIKNISHKISGLRAAKSMANLENAKYPGYCVGVVRNITTNRVVFVAHQTGLEDFLGEKDNTCLLQHPKRRMLMGKVMRSIGFSDNEVKSLCNKFAD